MVGANELPKTKKETWWKRRLEEKLKELSRDLDFVNNLIKKRNIKKKHEDRLERRYNIRRKRRNIVREEMKQRIKTVGAKIKRFNSRINQYQQNRINIRFCWLILVNSRVEGQQSRTIFSTTKQ